MSVLHTCVENSENSCRVQLLIKDEHQVYCLFHSHLQDQHLISPCSLLFYIVFVSPTVPVSSDTDNMNLKINLKIVKVKPLTFTIFHFIASVLNFSML